MTDLNTAYLLNLEFKGKMEVREFIIRVNQIVSMLVVFGNKFKQHTLFHIYTHIQTALIIIQYEV